MWFCFFSHLWENNMPHLHCYVGEQEYKSTLSHTFPQVHAHIHNYSLVEHRIQWSRHLEVKGGQLKKAKMQRYQDSGMNVSITSDKDSEKPWGSERQTHSHIYINAIHFWWQDLSYCIFILQISQRNVNKMHTLDVILRSSKNMQYL